MLADTYMGGLRERREMEGLSHQATTYHHPHPTPWNCHAFDTCLHTQTGGGGGGLDYTSLAMAGMALTTAARGSAAILSACNIAYTALPSVNMACCIARR